MRVDTSEDIALAQLKTLVDRTSEQLQWRNLTLSESLELIDQTRVRAEKLIPDQMDLYQFIYASRFQRLLEQFVTPRQLASPANWHKPF